MFFMIKRTHFLTGFILICCFVFILTGIGIFHSYEKTVDTMALPITNKTIVIDAGHGGFDAGASDNGILEKDINLKVAGFLKEYIEQSGGIAVMTRIDDTSTLDENRKDGSSAKQSDLSRRRDMPAEYEADLFVSIHMNKFPQTQYHGAQVFYAAKPEESKQIADILQDNLRQILDNENNRVAKKTDGNVMILNHATVPSVLIECGFLSNTEEAEKLKTEENQRKIAWAIYMGIIEYYNA